MIEQVTEYSFTYTHVNHSVFRGVIKATSIKNLHTQMLSLDGVEFVEINKI